MPIQVDIGFGDAVTPAPVAIEYPTLLNHPTPHLWAYPVETVVAEKLEALVMLGMANSRLKDFYDLWFIAQTFELRRSVVAEAAQRTFARRGTAVPVDVPVGLSDEFAKAKSAQWSAYLARDRMAAAPDAFSVVITDRQGFLMPMFDGAADDARVWPKGGPWSLR